MYLNLFCVSRIPIIVYICVWTFVNVFRIRTNMSISLVRIWVIYFWTWICYTNRHLCMFVYLYHSHWSCNLVLVLGMLLQKAAKSVNIVPGISIAIKVKMLPAHQDFELYIVFSFTNFTNYEESLETYLMILVSSISIKYK